jgi:hypothetical protein
MNMKSDVATMNWEKLKAALQQETANMEQAAGETIIEVNLLSDYEMALIHAKTRGRAAAHIFRGHGLAQS